MKHYLAVMKALSDPSRVRMLCALRGGDLCVCRLIALLGLAPSTVSKHLSVMNQAGLVESRKDGRWVYYRLERRSQSNVAARITRETFKALGDTTVIIEDAKRLDEIRQADPEELCRRIQ
jgi:DNA-binding transcriptional ArsR family regulator